MALPDILKNLPLPVIGSPLFIISNPKLVIEQCKAGVVGSMPALNARPAELLDEWLNEITTELAAYLAKTTRKIRLIAEGAQIGAVSAKNTIKPCSSV